MINYKIVIFNYDPATIKTFVNFLLEEKIVENKGNIKHGFSFNSLTIETNLDDGQLYEKLLDLSSMVPIHYMKNLNTNNKIIFHKHNPYM